MRLEEVFVYHLVKITADCGPAPEVANAQMGSTTPGLVKYSCVDGFELVDKDVNQLHCTFGSWTTEKHGQFPTCHSAESNYYSCYYSTILLFPEDH